MVTMTTNNMINICKIIDPIFACSLKTEQYRISLYGYKYRSCFLFVAR